MKALILLTLASSFFTNDPVKGKNGDKENPSKNQAPLANAGGKQIFKLNEMVQLDGTASREPDGIIARFQWTQVSGVPVKIANPAAAITSLSNVQKGDYVFRLTVTDEKGAVSSDLVKMTITE